MACLEIDLLGGVQARASGSSVAVAGRKERALLAVLALSPGESLARDKLAAMLWSDRGEKQAHDSLKSAIARLKKAFDPFEVRPIVSSRECVSLTRDGVTVDVTRFERLVREKSPESLAAAMALYRGDLLDGLDVGDRVFEEWLLLERQRLRVLARDALAELLEQYISSRNCDGAIATAHRLLALDPLRESAHRGLMRMYADQGQPTLAMKQYRICRDALRGELGVAPEAETIRLYQSIQEKRAGNGQTADQRAMTSAVAAHADPLSAPEAADLVRPVIAVLPFTNLSGDPEQQYFSDGITEDIITELTRGRSLVVIARNASFRHRGAPADISAMRQALGVRYVLEGSVRKAGDRIRVTAQLIDAVTLGHLWAERYDRDVQDIFAVQDDVTRVIVATLAGRIAASDAERTRRKPTSDWVAYDYFLQGRECDHRNDVRQAVAHLTRATELDPGYASAHGLLAVNLCLCHILDERQETLDEAMAHAQRALTLDENDVDGHDAMGCVALLRGQLDLAGHHFDRAVGLDPNSVNVAIDRAYWLMHVNRLDEALRTLDMGLQRNPYPPNWAWRVRGETLYFLKRYDEAISALRNEQAQYFWRSMFLAAAFAQSGQDTDARRELAIFVKAKPNASLASVSRSLVYADAGMREHLLEGLRMAGLAD